MDIDVFEDEIVSRLSSLSDTGITVVPCPEGIGGITEKNFDKGRIIVCYEQSKFDEATIFQPISQYEKVHVRLTFEFINRRGTNGLNEVYKQARKLLVGYSPTNCDKLYCKEFSAADYDRQGGYWYFDLVMCCTTVCLEDFEEENLGDLQDITPIYT